MDYQAVEERIRLEVNPSHANCYGIYWISNRGLFFIPELSKKSLFRHADLGRYLATKGLANRCRANEAVSDTNLMANRIMTSRTMEEFLPVSGWLEPGEQWLESGSLLIGHALPRIKPRDVPSPTLDRIEGFVKNPQEKKLFRSALARVVMADYSTTPVSSPLVVVTGGGNLNRELLKDLVSICLRGAQEWSRGVEHNDKAAAFIHWVVSDHQFTRDPEATFRRILEFSQGRELEICTDRRQRFFRIPALVFITLWTQLTEQCLKALPNPKIEGGYHHGTLVLSCSNERFTSFPNFTIPKEIEELELPGYLYRLLLEQVTGDIWNGYLAPEVRKLKWEKMRERVVYDELKKIYTAKITKDLGEIQGELESTPNRAAYNILVRDNPLTVMETISRFFPKEVRPVNGRWELNFSN